MNHLKQLAWETLDDSPETSEKPAEIARIIFTDPTVSDFLIRTSRLAVFSKELAKSFRSNLDALAAIKQLKFFYNLPTVAVLQQLANLVAGYVISKFQGRRSLSFDECSQMSWVGGSGKRSWVVGVGKSRGYKKVPKKIKLKN